MLLAKKALILVNHLYSKLRIGYIERCPCGTGSQTTEHLLQSCPIYEPLRGYLARPHSRSPQAVRKPEGSVMHCHLHRGDWSFHLTNEKKKKCSWVQVTYFSGIAVIWLCFTCPFNIEDLPWYSPDRSEFAYTLSHICDHLRSQDVPFAATTLLLHCYSWNNEILLVWKLSRSLQYTKALSTPEKISLKLTADALTFLCLCGVMRITLKFT